MGYMIGKLVQGTACLLILLFFGIAIFKFVRVIYNGLMAKEKK